MKIFEIKPWGMCICADPNCKGPMLLYVFGVEIITLGFFVAIPFAVISGGLLLYQLMVHW